jgi:hypothetical protein
MLIYQQLTDLVNCNNLIPKKFIWQRGFGVYGVSHSGVENVYRYIRNQKQHHQKRTFESEYIKFMELHGFEDVNPLRRRTMNKSLKRL